MTVTVTVSLDFKPDQIDVFWTGVLPGLQAGTKSYPGVLSVRGLRKADKPTEVLFVDVFENVAAYEGYFQWRRATGELDKLFAFLQGPPTIELWETSLGDEWLLHPANDGGEA